MTEISLFPRKVKKARQRQKLRKVMLQALLVWLLILALGMIGMSSYSMMLARKNKNLEVKIKKTGQRIEDEREIESKQVYLSSKLGSFETLLSSHERHQSITETIFSLLPSGTSLKGFSVGEEGLVNLSGSVPNFKVLEELLAKVRNSSAYRLSIIWAVMNKVSFAKEGLVNFDLAVMVGNKGK